MCWRVTHNLASLDHIIIVFTIINVNQLKLIGHDDSMTRWSVGFGLIIDISVSISIIVFISKLEA